MIDHVSIGVADLERAAAFYEPVLAEIGFAKLVVRAATVGFGKRYPEFWLNLRQGMTAVDPASGHHVCLRARSAAEIDAFYRTAVANGAADDGKPGLRPEYTPGYYAAFIRDPDGNRIEAVTFIENSAAPGNG